MAACFVASLPPVQDGVQGQACLPLSYLFIPFNPEYAQALSFLALMFLKDTIPPLLRGVCPMFLVVRVSVLTHSWNAASVTWCFSQGIMSHGAQCPLPLIADVPLISQLKQCPVVPLNRYSILPGNQ